MRDAALRLTQFSGLVRSPTSAFGVVFQRDKNRSIGNSRNELMEIQINKHQTAVMAHAVELRRKATEVQTELLRN